MLKSNLFLNIPDPTGKTLLRTIIPSLDLATIKALLDKGAKASINQQDKFGWTPLHSAVVDKNPEVVKLLLTYGASTQLKNNKGQTPCDYLDDYIKTATIKDRDEAVSLSQIRKLLDLHNASKRGVTGLMSKKIKSEMGKNLSLTLLPNNLAMNMNFGYHPSLPSTSPLVSQEEFEQRADALRQRGERALNYDAS